MIHNSGQNDMSAHIYTYFLCNMLVSVTKSGETLYVGYSTMSHLNNLHCITGHLWGEWATNMDSMLLLNANM